MIRYITVGKYRVDARDIACCGPAPGGGPQLGVIFRNVPGVHFVAVNAAEMKTVQTALDKYATDFNARETAILTASLGTRNQITETATGGTPARPTKTPKARQDKTQSAAGGGAST